MTMPGVQSPPDTGVQKCPGLKRLSFCIFLLISHFSLVLTVFHYSHFGGCVGVKVVAV